MRENLHVRVINLLEWIEFDSLKGDHRSGCGFLRGPSAGYGDAIPLGNLEDLHSENPVAVEETMDLLFQTLNVLE